MSNIDQTGFYRGLVIDSLIPEVFPAVALYMCSSSGNYILYKPAEVPFTLRDSERLANNGTKRLFVRTGDFGEVTEYLENNLATFLGSSELSSAAKSTILQQVSLEYIAKSVRTPQGIGAELKRCKTLLRHLCSHITSNEGLTGLVAGLSSSPFFMAHSVQVALLSMLMHEKLYSLERDEMIEVGVGGMLHDIGLTFLAGDLCETPEALSDLDWKKAQLHPTMGHDFLAKVEGISPLALVIVKDHHERWDGSGYPKGLKGNDISRSAQIAAACDIYSTLTNNQTFRKASTREDALKILHGEIGSYFNAEVYAALAEVVNGQPA